ncbi:transposase [Variovorax sp. CAN15]|uniref:transposase n=1 Tax=Variovorax sp. CAN15 TaxID=3046727 RepID=UPI0034635C1E
MQSLAANCSQPANAERPALWPTKPAAGAFVCEAAGDSFTCPASSALGRKQLSRKNKTVICAAQPGDCVQCARKPGGTTARRRFVTRHLYEEALEANPSSLAANPWMMALRRQTVEPLFASVKHLILGNARLRMRHLTGAQAEFALAVMAYNLKRVLNMKGHPRCAPGAAGPRPGAQSLAQRKCPAFAGHLDLSGQQTIYTGCTGRLFVVERIRNQPKFFAAKSQLTSLARKVSTNLGRRLR